MPKMKTTSSVKKRFKITATALTSAIGARSLPKSKLRLFIAGLMV